MSRLTPGHARSSCASVNSPENPLIAPKTSSVLAPRGLATCPTRSSKRRHADLTTKRRNPTYGHGSCLPSFQPVEHKGVAVALDLLFAAIPQRGRPKDEGPDP